MAQFAQGQINKISRYAILPVAMSITDHFLIEWIPTNLGGITRIIKLVLICGLVDNVFKGVI